MLTINHLLLRMANNRRQYLDTELERMEVFATREFVRHLAGVLAGHRPSVQAPFINYLVASLLDRSWSLVIDLFLAMHIVIALRVVCRLSFASRRWLVFVV